MKKMFQFSLALSALCFSANAQNIGTEYLGSLYLPQPVYNRMEFTKGSPFLSENWSQGDIKIKGDSIVYENSSMLYDQVLDQILINRGEKVWKVEAPVAEFTISDGKKLRNFKSGFPEIAGNDKNSFYEVLSNGSVKLLKQTRKDNIVFVGYNMVKELHYKDEIQYFAMDGEKMVSLKPTGGGMIATLNNQDIGDQRKYQGSHSFKSEDELVSFFEKLQ